MTGIPEIETRLIALEAQARAAFEAKKEGTPWGWIVALVLGVLIALGAAFLARKLERSSQELARLRTEVEQRAVALQQIEHEKSVGVHQEALTELERQEVVLTDELLLLDAQLRKGQDRHDSAVRFLEYVRDWENLDKYNARR